MVKATVYAKLGTTRLPGGRTLVKVQAGDDSAPLTLTWFNIPYAADKLLVDETYWFAGRVGGPLTAREMVSPVVRTRAQVKAAPFSAVYPPNRGAFQRRHRPVRGPGAGAVRSPAGPPAPGDARRYRLPDKWAAVRMIHRPRRARGDHCRPPPPDFEELLCLQLAPHPQPQPGPAAHLCSHGAAPAGAVLGQPALCPPPGPSAGPPRRSPPTCAAPPP